MKKQAIEEFNLILDKLVDEGITIFQIDFLKEVNYYTVNNGEVIFIGNYFYDKYSDIIDRKTFDFEIEDLLNRGMLIKQTRPTLYLDKETKKKKFATNIIYKIA